MPEETPAPQRDQVKITSRIIEVREPFRHCRFVMADAQGNLREWKLRTWARALAEQKKAKRDGWNYLP